MSYHRRLRLRLSSTNSLVQSAEGTRDFGRSDRWPAALLRRQGWQNVNMTEQQFAISVADEAIDDLHRRLRQTRWPDTVTGSGWTYGLDLDWMESIADYWL